MSKNTGNLYINTSFRNGGRKAGIGIIYDDYSEESGIPDCEIYEPVRFPHDNIDPKELNGECVIIKKGKVE